MAALARSVSLGAGPPVPLWAALALSAAAGHFLVPVVLQAAGLVGAATTTGRVKARGEKAWVLAVELTFKDEAKAQALLEAWREAAEWCYRHEPFLYHYEALRSDKDGTRYVIYERYHSKEEFQTAHRTSPAFLAFRPKLQALQEAGDVAVAGESYDELGIGFT